MPRPPIHCVLARQKRVAWVIESMSVMTVAPIVVKPLMVSKKAEATSMRMKRMKGSMPMSEKTTHERATTIKESAREKCSSALRRPRSRHVPPTVQLTKAERRKAHQSGSP